MPKINLLFLFVLLAWSSSALSNEKSPLIGAWRMTKLEVLVDGKLEKVSCSGQLIITDAGTLSAQAMDSNPNATPTTFTMNGYEALYGDIDINDSLNQFEITIQSSLVRDLIGRKMKRKFTISDRKMVLSPVDASEGWRVTYEHY
ncbi:lipocalin-like domain-containing protein [Shewanella sp. AS16]|uniref:lipocalin-like domain-containing protein n=1 Tax=Shewanella sp. AS16 TaxID=2907625 RepID=UPI001F3478FE|nr:lipocalin-like domain-containing protein [Shewanella sp. AS16]MCE9687342.1 lipocalin-like domain-containing protein [Shewanella sp. AS16]